MVKHTQPPKPSTHTGEINTANASAYEAKRKQQPAKLPCVPLVAISLNEGINGICRLRAKVFGDDILSCDRWASRGTLLQNAHYHLYIII